MKSRSNDGILLFIFSRLSNMWNGFENNAFAKADLRTAFVD